MNKWILTGLAIVSGNAFAQSNAFYVGAGGGGTNFESASLVVTNAPGSAQDVSVTVDDSDGNLRVFAGYRWTPSLAFEGVWSALGEFEQIDDDTGIDVTSDLTSFDVAAVGMLPLWDGRIDLFARAGLAFWSADTDVVAQQESAVAPAFANRPESSGQDLFWSVGLNINAFEDRRWTFRSELTTYEISDLEKLETLGFSIQYRF